MQKGHPTGAMGEANTTALRIDRILVPLDFSDCSLHALDYAVAFNEKFNAKLILLHVVEPTVFPDNYLNITATLDETNQNLVENGRERLAALVRKKMGGKVNVDILVRMGRAHSEIPDTAKALGVGLIIISTHGYTGLKHALLGSTAEKVLRCASCPVLTVSNSTEPTPERSRA
jgi:nucleotide-binding universal stress UspA family protein